MQLMVAVELVSAMFVGVSLVSQLSDCDKRKSTRTLKLCSALVLLWLCVDAVAYIYNGPQHPRAVIWLLNLLAYTSGGMVFLSFIRYCRLYITEQTEMKRWIFLIPEVVTVFNEIIILFCFVTNKLVTFENGFAVASGSIPPICQLLNIVMLVYLSFAVFTKRKVIGVKAVSLLGIYEFAPIVAITISLRTGRDFTVVFGAASVVMVASLLQKDEAQKAITEMNAVLKKTNHALQQVTEEQLAQLEEITALNAQLEENRERLEEAVSEQESQLEKISLLNTNLETKSSELERHLNIVGSLSNTFQALYFVDLTDGSFVELGSSREQVENVIGKKGSAKASFAAMCNYLVIPEHKAEMEAFTDLSTLQERLNGKPFISHQYCGQNGIWSEGCFVAVSQDEAGNFTGILWGVRIIDEFKKKEILTTEELMRAKEEAEAANNAKTSFLFNMSHDIRTPMNAIMGFRDLLEKHQDEPEKRQDYLKKIEEASTVLLSIINNVLEMARIEKGTVEIDETAWSAEQFNDTLYSVFHEMMSAKELTFTRQVEVQNHYVFCDPIKLREIFINIFSNAYKYTNAGGSVNMHLEEIPSSREGWALYQTTITDTGIGMAEEFIPHIFEEFSRENNTTDAKVEGTGLGMPIVKRLVEMLDGTIEVHSKKGEGSSFVVTIPHRIADKSNLVEHAGVQVDPKLFAGKRILLAEDNELNAEIAMEILGEVGFILDHAEDGAICVDMLKKAKSGYYDLVLMDIQMPHMNGYEATRAIRQLGDSSKANIKILAMTANAFEEDKREAFRAGMNGHLAKPINVNELMKTLTRILG